MTGKFPIQCKTAHITSVYKKGNKLDTSNQFHSFLTKVEKTMYSRLYRFLDKFNSLYKKQFCFQNSHSTNHALRSFQPRSPKV